MKQQREYKMRLFKRIKNKFYSIELWITGEYFDDTILDLVKDIDFTDIPKDKIIKIVYTLLLKKLPKDIKIINCRVWIDKNLSIQEDLIKDGNWIYSKED